MTAGFFSRLPPLRHSGMRPLAQARNPYSRAWLWIPGSLVSLTPRHDEYFLLSSQEALRIDVDLELEIAFGLRAGGKPLAQILRQIDAARRLHQQAEPIAALDHRKRGFGGSQHLDPLVDLRDRGQPSRKTFRDGPVSRP